MGSPKQIDARRYSRVAKQRLDEADLILQRLELWAVAQYVGGYAVECMLKALVIEVTPQNRRPPAGDDMLAWMKKDFGHDLNALRAYAGRRGARMPRDVSSDFVFVSTWDPQSRYEPGPGNAAEASRFLRAAKSVLKWADRRI